MPAAADAEPAPAHAVSAAGYAEPAPADSSTLATPEAVRDVVEEVAATSYGQLVAALATRTHDLSLAEDALSDAFVAALRTWPRDGIPDRPEAWLVTVARRRIIAAARHDAVRERLLPELAWLAARTSAAAPGPIEDERLSLLFVCAHPAIDPRVRAPLMLQAVLGLDAARIASAFLVAPATMSQRLVRAKTKIRDAGIPFAIPQPAELPGRLEAVLEGIYGAYGTGWDDVDGADPRRRGLTIEGLRLARLTAALLPHEPESLGLVALLCFLQSRQAARRSAEGRFVPLGEQDMSAWDRPLMSEAEELLARAAAMALPGRFQLEAAIQSVHAQRAVTGRTNWAAIALLYDGLIACAPSVGALVARAAALGRAAGPRAGLSALDSLVPDVVRDYQPYWVVRAHLLHQVSAADAVASLDRAVGLTADPAVRDYLLGLPRA